MPYEQRECSGSIFINKGTDQFPLKENSPAMTGKALVGGVLYKVAAWKKLDKSGEKYLSFAFTPVEEKPGDASVPTDNAPTIDDDLPF